MGLWPPVLLKCGSGADGGKRINSVALLRAVEVLKRVRTSNEDQKHGVDIVRKALSWPARQIALNAGEDGSI